MKDLTKIILATTNPGKKREFELALEGLPFQIKNVSQGFSCPEDGKNFFENALQKAQMAARISADSNSIFLADDSGLCAEALDGRPGLHSARYFGDGEGIQKLLTELKDSENRRAFFVCCLVLVNGAGELVWSTQEEWHGTIAEELSGNNGFGYDPIFIPSEFSLNPSFTVAELDSKQKEKYSHRGKAVSKLKNFLKIYSTGRAKQR